MFRQFIVATAVAATVAAAPVMAETINFDTGTAGTSVGSFYAAQGITFSNASFTSNLGLAGSSGSLGIFSTAGGYQFGSAAPIIATFTNLASTVTIRGIDVGQAGIRIEGYNAANVLVGFDEFFGGGVGVGTFHDLTLSAAGIKSFRLFQPATVGGSNPYGDGVLFDNLSFTSSAAVPEPATWAMMIGGFGAIGGAMRYRRRKVAVSFA